MAKEVRFVLLHALLGSVAGLFALGLVLWSDVGLIRTMLWTSPDATAALALLGVGFAVTFGSAALGGAVISLGSPGPDEPPPARGRTIVPTLAPEPARAIARATRR